MSVQPLCKKPSDLKSFKQSEFKGKFLKFLKKLAKKHDSFETATPFYLGTEVEFADGSGFFMAAGKIKDWKKYAKDNASQNGLRGVCYVTYDEAQKSLMLNLCPVAGALKNKATAIAKAMKTVVSASRCQVVLDKEVTEKDLDAREDATEKLEDVADDAAADAMEDAVEDMQEAVEKAQATAKSPAEAKALAAMAADIESLENLLEKMAASDNAAEIQTLDKEIRTIFAKYQSKK